MAIVEIPGGGFFVPPPVAWSESGVPAFETYTLDTTTRKFAVIFRAPRSCTLDKFEFGLRTVTQAPVDGLKVSFQDVSGGEPNGTATYYRVYNGAMTTNSWIDPDTITDDGTDNGNKKVVSRGDLVACVIEFVSFDTGDDIDIAVLAASQYAIKGAYVITANGGGTWTKGDGIPCIALARTDFEVIDETSSGYFAVPNTYPVYDIEIVDVQEGGDPEGKGLLFQFPVPVRIGGGYVFVSPLVDFDIVLYDVEDDYSEMERVNITLDDYFPNGDNLDYIEFRFTDDHLIGANKPYILSIEPTDNSDVVTIKILWSYDLYRAQCFPFGSNWFLSGSKVEGVWVGDGLKNLLPLFGLLVTGTDQDTSGGGGGSGWEGIS